MPQAEVEEQRLSRRSIPSGDKPIARRRVAAAPGPVSVPTELLEIETSASEARWRIHDRTHLELTVEVPADAEEEHLWEAYFFLPKSLKVSSATYDRSAIYRDFQSYVRFSMPLETPAEFASTSFSSVLGEREMRLFAARFRQVARLGRGDVLKRAAKKDETAAHIGDVLTTQLQQALRNYRKATRAHDDEAAKWVDEDCSRILEGCAGDVSIALRRAGYPDAAGRIAARAVGEAAYRNSSELGDVGHGGATKRDVEHLEYRRHLLKRFTSSALWLRTEVTDAGRYTLHALYAIAACVAMAFAVAAALYNGTPDANRLGNIWSWTVLAMLAYAGKDRIKATLQGVFAKWVHRRLPDRRWRLFAAPDDRIIGRIVERTGFVKGDEIPEPVMTMRTQTHRHPLEYKARPETTLWHEKRCQLVPARCKGFGAVSEVFRLDISDWLTHTDEPKQRIVFADPEDGHIYTASAPRVYNISVVFRCRTRANQDAPWQRVRVVVSRKGIRRLERVATSSAPGSNTSV